MITSRRGLFGVFPGIILGPVVASKPALSPRLGEASAREVISLPPLSQRMQENAAEIVKRYSES